MVSCKHIDALTVIAMFTVLGHIESHWFRDTKILTRDMSPELNRDKVLVT